MFTQMVSQNNVYRDFILSFRTSSRTRMWCSGSQSYWNGFFWSNHWISSTIINHLFSYRIGKSSCSTVNDALEYRWCSGKLVQRLNNYSQNLIIHNLMLFFPFFLVLFLLLLSLHHTIGIFLLNLYKSKRQTFLFLSWLRKETNFFLWSSVFFLFFFFLMFVGLTLIRKDA